MSYYDFPEVFLCLFHHECTSIVEASSFVPFVTFFSGHIATIVIIANHLYLRKFSTLSILLHTFNWLQALRLLATRGHYSIDLIIGYVVAVWVSDPAERLGLYYSRGVSPALPKNAKETFEILVGVRVSDSRTDATDDIERKDHLKETAELKLRRAVNSDDLHNVQSETSVRVAIEIVTELALNRSGFSAG
jgi:hypothetical protein